MTIKESLEDLRDRLETLQQSLAAKIAEFRSDESASPEHRERVDALHAQAAAVKAKLPADDGSVWDAIRHEVQRDMDALSKDFEHTITYIDDHYREKN